MSSNDFDALMRSLSGSSSDGTQTAARLSALLRTPDGQQLVQNLMQVGGNSVTSAISSAQQGDFDSARQSIQALLSTPQGAQIAAQIARMMGR